MAEKFETMVVVNLGTQGCTKFRYEPGTRVVLEKKHFPPKVPVTCSVEIGEALLNKHNDPTKALFFRNPNNPTHRAQIKKFMAPGFSLASLFEEEEGDIAGTDGELPEIDDEKVGEKLKSKKRKYVRRKK